MTISLCRFCDAPLTITFVDLGMSPLSNAFIKAEDVSTMEQFYPLHAYVCDRCFLVQLEEFESPSHIFSDYAYFSSYSTSWLEHCERYVDSTISLLGLSATSLVVEIASNDGYLLQYFEKRNIPILGIEPAANVAKVAQERGIPTVVAFFGVALAKALSRQGTRPDLIVANNVLAHVPNINDFVAGIKILLGDHGTATFEFPHLLKLIEFNQFDTMYHEHFSYFSLLTVVDIFAHHGLLVYDVDEIPTHGGSLRIFVTHEGAQAVSGRVQALIDRERSSGLGRIETYATFGSRVSATKRALLSFLIEEKNAGKRIVGYGAAAKGTTLLNYCGVRTDFLDFIVDLNPYKQGRFLPGCHIPIVGPEAIGSARPDYLLILPWNIKDEVREQLSFARAWGARFVVPIPRVEVIG